MDATGVCSICGKPPVPDAPHGLCPECLMRFGFESKAVNDPSGGKSAFVPPPADQVAKLFPQSKLTNCWAGEAWAQFIKPASRA